MTVFANLAGTGPNGEILTATVQIDVVEMGRCADFIITNTSSIGLIDQFLFNLNTAFDSTVAGELSASMLEPSTWVFDDSADPPPNGFDHSSGGCGSYQYIVDSTVAGDRLGPGESLSFRLCSNIPAKIFVDPTTFTNAPDAEVGLGTLPFQLAVSFQQLINEDSACVGGRFVAVAPTTAAPTTAAPTTAAPTTAAPTTAAPTTAAPTTAAPTTAAPTTAAPTTAAPTTAAPTTAAPTTAAPTTAAPTTAAPTTAAPTTAPPTTAPPVCPVANPQTCCQHVIEFKTQLVSPALGAGNVTTRVYFSQAPVVEDVCPEKVIICGKLTKEIEYIAVDGNGDQSTNILTDERDFQCVIDRDDANEGDKFDVVGYAVLCEGQPFLQNRGTRPGPGGTGSVNVFWKLKEKDIIKVCIRKRESNS